MGSSEAVPDMRGRCLAGRYRLTDMIGSGGAGNVWAAVDEVLGRRVAVKDVGAPPWLSVEGWQALRERTLREARAAAVISHPNVVTVYDVVEEDSRPWIVMQLVEARTLAQIIHEDGPCPPQQVAEIGLQMLAALEAAHDHGILHRDVKPSNVLVEEDGRAVLTDFGIATVDGDAALTASGVLVGAPAYIAPERIKGDAAGPPSDLWSLGATLYTAVEGHPPYRRDDPMCTIAAVVHDDPDPPSMAGTLAPLLERLLHKDPEQRPSAAEVERFLRYVVSPAPESDLELATVHIDPDRTRHVVAGVEPSVVAGVEPDAESSSTQPPHTRPVAMAAAGLATAGSVTTQQRYQTESEQPTRRRLRMLALLTAAATMLLAILLTGYLARHTLEPGSPSHRPGGNQPVHPGPVADDRGVDSSASPEGLPAAVSGAGSAAATSTAVGSTTAVTFTSSASTGQPPPRAPSATATPTTRTRTPTQPPPPTTTTMPPPPTLTSSTGISISPTPPRTAFVSPSSPVEPSPTIQ
jgi:eukaryotic-like serine/threonine-protein kinase